MICWKNPRVSLSARYIRPEPRNWPFHVSSAAILVRVIGGIRRLHRFRRFCIAFEVTLELYNTRLKSAESADRTLLRNLPCFLSRRHRFNDRHLRADRSALGEAEARILQQSAIFGQRALATG